METVLEDWFKKITSAENSAARSLFDPLIASSRKTLKSGELLITESRKKALVRGILCRGLQDLTDLLEVVHTTDWLKNPTLVEEAWNHLWDARDRLTYAIGQFSHERIRWGLAQLEQVYKDFVGSFGPGLYCSPEIVCKREICNICKADFRSCSHMRDEIYDGVRCIGSPDGIEFRATAIVAVPADPRCRIWPWQLKEEGGQWKIEGLCILTSFHLEDFLDTD